MSPFLAFLDLLLDQGRVILDDRPRLGPEDRDPAADRLRAAFAVYSLDIAGPPVSLDAPAALEAAELLWWSSWFLVQRREPAEELERALPVPGPLRSAAQHLSSDLLLRFLPAVHRRARAVAVDDPLTRRLEDVLRRRPLSGVLADLDEGPVGAVELGGHPGLLLLYAERLAEHMRPAWVPEGEALALVELVCAERGVSVPVAHRRPAEGEDLFSRLP